MNTTRFAALITLAALALIVIAGCGGSGSKTHDVTTDSIGASYGMLTDPSDGQDGVDVDTRFRVSWPDPDYPPPASFTFRLDRDDGPYDWTAVYTEMTSDPGSKVWVFEPTRYLATGKWYKATITDDRGRRQVVFFRTYGSSDDSLSRQSSRSGSGEQKGAVEHQVSTRTQPM